MKISIIIPVYNAEKYLDKCINSLISQTLKEIEFIFVNDGSDDNSIDILKKYRNIDSRIKIIDQENKGVSFSRNIALDYCNGEYIGFVDSDDYIEKDMYKHMYRTIVNEKSDLVICEMTRIYGKFKRYKYYFNNISKDIKLSILKDFLISQGNGFCCNKLYKRSIIENKNIKFNTDISITEDLLFNLKYLKYVDKISYLNEFLYNYNIRNNSSTYKSHKNGFEVSKIMYSETIDNSYIWNMNTQEIIDKINSLYSEYPFLYIKNTFFDRKLDFVQRINIIENIVEDTFTKKITNKVKNKKINVSLKTRVFYKILKSKKILVIYLNILHIFYILKLKLKNQYIYLQNKYIDFVGSGD